MNDSIGELTWPIIRDLVDDVITVTEEEIVRAMRLIYERMKIVIEPSAAVGLAVAITDTFKQTWLKDEIGEVSRPRNIGIIICGGRIVIIHISPVNRQC